MRIRHFHRSGGVIRHHRRCAHAVLMAVVMTASAAASPAIANAAQAPDQPASRPAHAEETARMLLGEKKSDEEPLKRMMTLMDEAARRLNDMSDTGPRTQAAQRAVLEAIDEALQGAGDDSGSPQGSQSKKPSGDKRRSGRRQSAKSGTRAAQRETQSGRSGRGQDKDAPAGKPLADIPEVRRGWGYLAARDRDAVIQGASEEYHLRYREQIEEYYRAIAEQAEKQK